MNDDLDGCCPACWQYAVDEAMTYTNGETVLCPTCGTTLVVWVEGEHVVFEVVP